MSGIHMSIRKQDSYQSAGCRPNPHVSNQLHGSIKALLWFCCHFPCHPPWCCSNPPVCCSGRAPLCGPCSSVTVGRPIHSFTCWPSGRRALNSFFRSLVLLSILMLHLSSEFYFREWIFQFWNFHLALFYIFIFLLKFPIRAFITSIFSIVIVSRMGHISLFLHKFRNFVYILHTVNDTLWRSVFLESVDFFLVMCISKELTWLDWNLNYVSLLGTSLYSCFSLV